MKSAETRIHEAQEYLNATDYKVIKWAEGVEEPDEEIKRKRQKARDTINECLNEIKSRPVDPDEFLREV